MSRGSGIGRVIFLGSNNGTIDNKYIVGSGVGSLNASVRRALKRRANNNAQGEPCCDKPKESFISNFHAHPAGHQAIHVSWQWGLNSIGGILSYYPVNNTGQEVAAKKSIYMSRNADKHSASYMLTELNDNFTYIIDFHDHEDDDQVSVNDLLKRPATDSTNARTSLNKSLFTNLDTNDTNCNILMWYQAQKIGKYHNTVCNKLYANTQNSINITNGFTINHTSLPAAEPLCIKNKSGSFLFKIYSLFL